MTDEPPRQPSLPTRQLGWETVIAAFGCSLGLELVGAWAVIHYPTGPSMAVDGASQQPAPVWLWHAGLGLFAVSFLTFLATGGGRVLLGAFFNNPARVEWPRGMENLGDGLVCALFVAPMIPIAILAGVVSPGSAYRWVPLLAALLASGVGAVVALGWWSPRG